MLRVLLRRPVALVREHLLEFVGVHLELVGQLRGPVEELLTLDRLADPPDFTAATLWAICFW